MALFKWFNATSNIWLIFLFIPALEFAAMASWLSANFDSLIFKSPLRQYAARQPSYKMNDQQGKELPDNSHFLSSIAPNYSRSSLLLPEGKKPKAGWTGGPVFADASGARCGLKKQTAPWRSVAGATWPYSLLQCFDSVSPGKASNKSASVRLRVKTTVWMQG